MIIPQFVLPANVQLSACSIVFQNESLFINASASQSGSYCPLCRKRSVRIHSKYLRELSDLPISGNLVRIKLTARKYFCDNSWCQRRIFTERFAHEITPHCRRLTRSNDLLFRIALALGGNNGSTISSFIGVPVSASTILRIIEKNDIAVKTVTSGIIGVDDWAFKKGNTYGTILVDLHSKEVVDLLPDRKAETLTQWLKCHPEVQVVSRDRYGPYALGAKNGAPQAIQVADRFHLLMNLGEATKKMFQAKGKVLKEVFNLYNNPTQSKLPEKTGKQFEQPPPQTMEVEADNVNPDRQHKFEKVKELYAKGYSIRSIARALKAHRQTVKKYIGIERLSKRKNRRITNFDSFHDFLLQESPLGKTYKELYHTILTQGFTGSYSRFCNNLNALLKEHKIISKSSAVKLAPVKTWSPQQLSLMLYRDKDKLNQQDSKFLRLLYDKCQDIKQTGELVARFKNLFQFKEEGSLRTWIEDAIRSESGIKSFAKNLIKDFDAVNNAVITPYSNGQVEGQINKLKNIKRSMYGRASFQLLRKMVLFSSG